MTGRRPALKTIKPIYYAAAPLTRLGLADLPAGLATVGRATAADSPWT